MANSIDVHIGNRVRIVREVFGLTQQELADKVEVELGTIREYESGETRIPFSRLEAIADALAVPVDCFFDASSLHTPSTAQAQSHTN